MYSINKNYLLPNRYKEVGIWMFFPFAILCLSLFFYDYESMDFTLPFLSIFNLPFLSKLSFFKIVESNPLNEIFMLGLLTSLCFIALSEEKDEDEMTAHVRVSSFVWSLWATAIVLAFGILFLFEFAFLYFSFIAIYLFFMLYILKFHCKIKAIRKEVE